MELIERVLQNLKERREKILKGEVNCIPSPFNRFRSEFAGIEQGRYYLLSGNTKAAKTQLTSYLFLFNPILYAYENPDKVKVTVFYYLSLPVSTAKATSSSKEGSSSRAMKVSTSIGMLTPAMTS